MMKLSLGLRVVRDRVRWRIVSFDGFEVRLRRLEYRASMDGRGPMEWCDTDIVETCHRGNFDILYQEDPGVS
jgi:hypothetical protein